MCAMASSLRAFRWNLVAGSGGTHVPGSLVEPVEVWQRPQVGLYSISCRVLRSEIYRDIPERSFGHAGLVSRLVPPEKRCRPSAVPKRSRNLSLRCDLASGSAER